MLSVRKSLLIPVFLTTSLNVFAGNGAHLIGWQNFSAGGDGSVNDNTPDTNSTYDDTPVGSISLDGHYLSGSVGVDASNAGLSGNGVATNNGYLNGNNYGGSCGGNGEFIERWPLAGTSPSYEEVNFTSASCVSGTTITLSNAGHNFTLGDAVFVSGLANDSINGAKVVSDANSTSISFVKDCTADPSFATNQACDGSQSVGENVLVSDKIGERVCPYGSNCAKSWKFTKSGVAQSSTSTDDAGLAGDFSVTNNSDYYFRLEFVHFDARSGNNTCNTNNRSPYLLEVTYLRESSNLINKEEGTELVAGRLIESVDWGACPAANGKVVNQISASIASIIESAAYLPPGETAAFRFKFNSTGTFGAFGVAQIDNIAFEGTFFETAALQSEIDPASVPLPVIEEVPMTPLLFQLFLAACLALVSIRTYLSKRIF